MEYVGQQMTIIEECEVTNKISQAMAAEQYIDDIEKAKNSKIYRK